MPKKPTILFLPKWYPNKFDILDGNFIENHAKAIAQFCDVAVIFVHSDLELDQSYVIEKKKTFDIPEIKVYFKKPNLTIGILNKIITFYRYAKAQRLGYIEYKKANPTPDLCHIHVMGRTAPLAMYLKWKKNIPFLISEHWSGYHKISGVYKGFFKKWATKFTVKRAVAVTAVSEDLAKAMQSHHLKSNYTIIPNVIDTSVFIPIEKNTTDKKRFIHISNLSKVPKNLHSIINNLSDVAETHKNFEFVLIGYGEEEEEMLELIEHSNIRKLTSFKGKMTKEEVAKELALSDAMLLFSLYENQPCVMLESFSTGCPVIVPNVGGIAEIMNEKLGILVESRNNTQFKQAVIDILDNKKTFDRSSIRTYAENNFSEPIVGKQFFDLYKTILQGAKE